jgi:hypothetical protein
MHGLLASFGSAWFALQVCDGQDHAACPLFLVGLYRPFSCSLLLRRPLALF